MAKSAQNIAKSLRKPVVLIGMMGSGKTHVGINLAQALKLEFVDADQRIEQSAGMSIPDIFEKYGESEFRRLEKRVIENLLGDAVVRVIALGGGAIMDAQTALLVKEKAHSIWVQAPLEEMLDRVSKNANRPLLACEDPKSVLQKLMEERRLQYEKADCHVLNEDSRAAQAVREILTFLQETEA